MELVACVICPVDKIGDRQVCPAGVGAQCLENQARRYSAINMNFGCFFNFFYSAKSLGHVLLRFSCHSLILREKGNSPTVAHYGVWSGIESLKKMLPVGEVFLLPKHQRHKTPS